MDADNLPLNPFAGWFFSPHPFALSIEARGVLQDVHGLTSILLEKLVSSSE